MPVRSAAPRSRFLEMALCVIVLIVMLVSVLYAAWISLDNYSNIGV